METLTQTYEPPQAYEPIKIELAKDEVQNVMDSYLNFLTLPQPERERLFHLDESRPRTGETGYVRKNADSSSHDNDNKHYFHMTPDLWERFQPISLEGRKLPFESKLLIWNSHYVYQSLGKAALQKYIELETDFPLLKGIHFPSNGTLQHKLRLVAYQGGKDKTLAAGHYDKGTGTIAVAESHGGLRVGHSPKDLQLVERDQFEPIFFHGYGWHQLAEMLDVKTGRRAAWHDVIDTGERVREDVMRWAMIYFLDPANIYLESTKEQTHTPIPWRGLGNLVLRNDNQSFLTS